MLAGRLTAVATVVVTTCLQVPRANAQKVYWTDPGTGKVQHAGVNVSNAEGVVTAGLESPAHFSVVSGPDIPALSEWGMAVMAGLLLAMGSLVLVRPRIALQTETETCMYHCKPEC